MTAKQDALDTLAEAQKMIDSSEPMTGLRLSHLRATIEYAVVAVEKIEELKRKRRKENKS